MHLSAKASRKLINIMTVVCGIIIIFLVIYWYRLGIFTSQTKMKAYLANKKSYWASDFCFDPNRSSCYSNYPWWCIVIGWGSFLWPNCWIYL